MLTWSLDPVVAYANRTLLPVGAYPTPEGVVFRVWAPQHEEIRVVTGATGEPTRYVPLERDAEGFFSGRDEEGKPGDQYWFQIEEQLVPDPASRFQPEGVSGPSLVVDPRAYPWRTGDWRRPPLRGRVIYELHVGAFTREGSFAAALRRLDALVELGINTIELMPVADFPGRWNWGYDGVMLFAPARCYGTPGELRALVDAAHARGLAVILDVVYNHLGPIGNVLGRFSPHYFHRTSNNPWGGALNFDGEQAGPVREFFLQNACMWLDEYRFDGLRLDAVHAIEDESPTHLIAEVALAAHARGAIAIAEDERNDATVVTPRARGGWGVDGMWADDFHHTVRVGFTGERVAHLANYAGTIDEWVETLRHGWFFRGQHFPAWNAPRGNDPSALPAEAFVVCISNHDQIGNRPLGDRLSEVVSGEAYRAATVLLCLAPFTPMLFMGQEWAASAPFPFFTDHPGEIGASMAANRIREFRSRQAHYPPEALARMPEPQAEATFLRAKLDWSERVRPPHRETLALYRECLRLRARKAVFQSPPREGWRIQKADADTLALRWSVPSGDWLLLVSRTNDLQTMPGETFCRSRAGHRWERVLASNEERFGGAGRGAPAAVLWRERA